MTTPTLLGLILVLVQSAVTALLTAGLLRRWLEYYKSELTLALGWITRFDEKEFAALKEAWTKARDAVVGMDELLRRDGGSEEDRAAAAAGISALHDFFLDGDVYLPVGLSTRFAELDQTRDEVALDRALKCPVNLVFSCPYLYDVFGAEDGQ